MDSGDAFEAELGEKLGALKRAAIDAAMAGGDRPYSLQEDSYTMSAMNGTTTFNYKVTRPDSNGLGGGDLTISESSSSGGGQRGGSAYDSMAKKQSEEIKKSFDSVRSDIDGLFKPWKTLPDPSLISNNSDYYAANVTAKLASASDQIKIPDAQTLPEPAGDDSSNGATSTVDTSSATYRPHGPMGTRLEIGRYMNELRGDAMDTFSQIYEDKLPLIVKDLCYLSNIHCCTLLAEYGFFKKARAKVIEIAEQATARFKDIANKQAPSSKMALNAIGWGLSLLSLPTGGGSELALAAGKLALTVVKDVTSEGDREATVKTYEDMKNELSQTLESLKKELEKGEGAVKSTLTNNHNNAKTDKDADFETASLHLVPSPIVSGANEMQMDDENVNKVSSRLLSVGDLLEEAAGNIAKAPMLVHRDGSIGIGENGPSSEYNSLGQMLYELLLDLKWQIEEGVINLKLALNDFTEQDESSAAALRSNASDMNAGSGMNPWDNNKQTDKDLRRDPYFSSHDDHNPQTPTQDPSRQELAQEKSQGAGAQDG